MGCLSSKHQTSENDVSFIRPATTLVGCVARVKIHVQRALSVRQMILVFFSQRPSLYL